MDNLDLAVHNAVHEAPISTKEIAANIGVSHQILINKVNFNNDTHKLSLREAIAIQLATKSNAIHDAAGLILGVQAVPVSVDKPKSLTTAILHATKEQGDISQAIEAAIADGKITQREHAHCLTQVNEAIAALCALRESLGDIQELKSIA